MTEITYVVTIIASISFVIFIIYPLLKGDPKIIEGDVLSISTLDILQTKLHNTQSCGSSESIEIIKETIRFLKDKDEEYEKAINELISEKSERKFIICPNIDCYSPIRNYTKKCHSCSIDIDKELFNL